MRKFTELGRKSGRHPTMQSRNVAATAHLLEIGGCPLLIVKDNLPQ